MRFEYILNLNKEYYFEKINAIQRVIMAKCSFKLIRINIWVRCHLTFY